MKIHDIKIIALLAIVGFASCKKDNYPAPDASISGNIIDAATGAKVPQQTLNGGLIQLYETTYPNPTPINSTMNSDGSYANRNIFAGNYRIVATGPFIYQDAIQVTVNGQTTQDIKVVPYLTVTTTLVSKTSTSITVNVKLTQSALSSTQKIALVAAVAGITNSVDYNNYARRESQNTESVTNASIVANTYTFVLTGLKPNTSYYVRGAARTNNNGNYFNYAPVFEVTTNN
ncbi:DUF3823 domain-containing protein [Pedobacter chinensis]|uniref:DUF3823 domain-containing protein n=1 Tax=Pedobacter chinensis TaxID=2282421 RepID=A0A369PXY7_9SPHI|nr:DUF3823 domain-containing protein [Pedobacter chinensis]RDC57364.1 DUF3823 domain-containing protein [Pedobacter chinensis]